MNQDEARACFDRALDGELSQDERRAFDEALAREPSLRDEFSKLEQVVEATRSLAAASPPVDLLGGVQTRLRERSGGRFYRDRFSEQSGRGALLMWMLAGASLVLIAAAAWLALDFGVLVEPPAR